MKTRLPTQKQLSIKEIKQMVYLSHVSILRIHMIHIVPEMINNTLTSKKKYWLFKYL
jgi:hypothetical protein